MSAPFTGRSTNDHTFELARAIREHGIGVRMLKYTRDGTLECPLMNRAQPGRGTITWFGDDTDTSRGPAAFPTAAEDLSRAGAAFTIATPQPVIELYRAAINAAIQGQAVVLIETNGAPDPTFDWLRLIRDHAACNHEAALPSELRDLPPL
jgi:hypothetical protein